MKNIKKHWQGEWPWEDDKGVGLKLSGVPKDEKAFVSLLMQQNCNKVAAIRILKDLKTVGVKFTTVQSSLNFDEISQQFSLLGIKMEVVPPVKSEDTTLIDKVALDILQGKQINRELPSRIIIEAIKRASQTSSILPLFSS